MTAYRIDYDGNTPDGFFISRESDGVYVAEVRRLGRAVTFGEDLADEWTDVPGRIPASKTTDAEWEAIVRLITLAPGIVNTLTLILDRMEENADGDIAIAKASKAVLDCIRVGHLPAPETKDGAQ